MEQLNFITRTLCMMKHKALTSFGCGSFLKSYRDTIDLVIPAIYFNRLDVDNNLLQQFLKEFSELYNLSYTGEITEILGKDITIDNSIQANLTDNSIGINFYNSKALIEINIFCYDTTGKKSNIIVRDTKIGRAHV